MILIIIWGICVSSVCWLAKRYCKYFDLSEIQEVEVEVVALPIEEVITPIIIVEPENE